MRTFCTCARGNTSLVFVLCSGAAFWPRHGWHGAADDFTPSFLPHDTQSVCLFTTEFHWVFFSMSFFFCVCFSSDLGHERWREHLRKLEEPNTHGASKRTGHSYICLSCFFLKEFFFIFTLDQKGGTRALQSSAKTGQWNWYRSKEKQAHYKNFFGKKK